MDVFDFSNFFDRVKTNVIQMGIEGNSNIDRFFPISMYHACSLGWSDKCAHCDNGFDALAKQLLSPLKNPAQLTSLKEKIDECVNHLAGLQFSFQFCNQIYNLKICHLLKVFKMILKISLISIQNMLKKILI